MDGIADTPNPRAAASLVQRGPTPHTLVADLPRAQRVPSWAIPHAYVPGHQTRAPSQHRLLPLDQRRSSRLNRRPIITDVRCRNTSTGH